MRGSVPTCSAVAWRGEDSAHSEQSRAVRKAVLKECLLRRSRDEHCGAPEGRGVHTARALYEFQVWLFSVSPEEVTAEPEPASPFWSEGAL